MYATIFEMIQFFHVCEVVKLNANTALPRPVLPDLSPNHLMSGIINGVFIDLFFIII